MTRREPNRREDNNHRSLPKNMKRSTRKLVSLKRRDYYDCKNNDKMERKV